MIWICEECPDWGEADNDVDLAVSRQLHEDTHRGVPLEIPAEEEPVTAWAVTLTLWGVTAALGFLSAKIPALRVAVPFFVVIAGILAYNRMSGD